MRRKAVSILSIAIGTAVLIIGSMIFYGWLNRPLAVPIDDPTTQPIKEVLVKSHRIEHVLNCDPNADVNLLDEVYKNTADYKQSPDNLVMIVKYLGKEEIKGAGYLSFIKAYHLWRRSGDLYPSARPNPTQEYLATVSPQPKPSSECPKPTIEPEVLVRSIAIRGDKAVVVYNYGAYLTKVVLRKVDGDWFVVSSHYLAVNI